MLKSNKNQVVDEEKDELDFPWTLRRLHAHNLNRVEKAYGRLFYWAGFYGEKKLCQLFLKKIGVSPFMKFHDSQNVIGACIKGC